MEINFEESCDCDNDMNNAIRKSGVSIRFKSNISSNVRNWVLEGDSNVMLRFLQEYNKLKCREYNFNDL